MRRVRITLGLMVAVCAVAFSATTALATNFTAGIVGKVLSEATPAKIKGGGVGLQHFKFGPVHITCEKASAKGLATETVFETLKLIAKYSYCTTAIKVGTEPATLATKMLKPIEYNFHANGLVETGTEGEEGSMEIGSGEAEWKISGIKCLISWPAQTVPIKHRTFVPAAIFSNVLVPNEHLKAFPSGFQNKLQISSEFKSMKFVFSEGQCSEFKAPEANTGGYEGTLLEEITAGNLGFE
jgi:hypothetical protein